MEYNQLYIIDTDTVLNHRMQQHAHQSFQDDVMLMIHHVMEKYSSYLRAYKHMAEVEKHELIAIYITINTNAFQTWQRSAQVQSATFDKVPVVFVGDDGALPLDRDIIVYPRNKPLQNISFMSANCDSMTYPVLFQEETWVVHCNLKHAPEYSTLKCNATILCIQISYQK